MKRWPIIRHIRAIIVVWGYVWRAVLTWNITDVEKIVSNPLFAVQHGKARRIWEGEE